MEGRALGEVPNEQQCRNFLGGFNFIGDKVFDPVSTFSGGEKARLALALIAWSKPNLLLMDEPTNHLDLDMRQALTVALQSFEGAIVLVSHDQHLVENTVDQLLLIEDGRVTPFTGDIEDYRVRQLPGRKPQAPRQKQEAPVETKPVARPGKQLRQLRTRINTVTTRMERLQRKLAEVESRLTDPALYEDHDNADLHGLLRDQLSLKEELEPLEEEWLDLSGQLEALG